MKKIVLMSILVAIFWIPVTAARDSQPYRGLRNVRKRFAVFCVAYVITVLYVMPRL
jgi:hypothetical protein